VGVHFGLAGQGPEMDHQRFTRIPGGGAELGARRRDIALPVLLGERRTQYNQVQNEPIRRRPLLVGVCQQRPVALEKHILQ
jgi:hypothetical protein